MKKTEIKLDKVYAVRISGKIVPVRVYSLQGVTKFRHGVPYQDRTHYMATNLATQRDIRIHSAAKFRYEMEMVEGKWKPVRESLRTYLKKVIPVSPSK